MQRLSMYVLVLLLALLAACPELFSQRILILEKPGTVKNIKFKTGDELIICKKGEKKKISGEINKINDSVLLINYVNEVYIRDIEFVYKPRGLSGFMSEIGYKAGIAYLLLDITNRLIQAESPVFVNSTMIISGSLIATALLFRSYRLRPYKLGDNWRLRVIDFDKTTFN